jgi:hypothetical protein
MRVRFTGLLLAFLPITGWAGELTAEQIMSRVAANQERAQELRQAYVYEQEVRTRVLKGATKLVREETRRYVVTPTAKGSQREQTQFLGRVRFKKELLEYHDPDYATTDVDLDGNFAEAFSEGFFDFGSSRDGIEQDWFPLTGDEQRPYRFHLVGEEDYRGRRVYSIAFEPRKKSSLLNEEQGTWKGEILVDQEQFQPVLIVTELAKGVPLWIRTVFGTNVKQVGFKMAYEEFDDGVWFPGTYGGEFKIKALFFYKRTIAVSMVNSGFQRAEVTSRVEFAEENTSKP